MASKETSTLTRRGFVGAGAALGACAVGAGITGCSSAKSEKKDDKKKKKVILFEPLIHTYTERYTPRRFDYGKQRNINTHASRFCWRWCGLRCLRSWSRNYGLLVC